MMALALAAALLWGPQRASEAQASDDVDAFVKRHWRLPIPPQGEPPAAFSPIEASLHPKECALCHRQQFEDWKTSLHSRSMGPGIYGQLLNMEEKPATYTICATCHTPLSEQIPHVKEGSDYRPNESFDPELQAAGLVCAGCHVRQHERFGPPRRPEIPTPPADVVAAARRFYGHHGIPALRVLQAVPPGSARAPLPSTASCSKTPLSSGRPAPTPRKACSAKAATCRTAATCGAASRTRTWCGRR